MSTKKDKKNSSLVEEAITAASKVFHGWDETEALLRRNEWNDETCKTLATQLSLAERSVLRGRTAAFVCNLGMGATLVCTGAVLSPEAQARLVKQARGTACARTLKNQINYAAALFGRQWNDGKPVTSEVLRSSEELRSKVSISAALGALAPAGVKNTTALLRFLGISTGATQTSPSGAVFSEPVDASLATPRAITVEQLPELLATVLDSASSREKTALAADLVYRLRPEILGTIPDEALTSTVRERLEHGSAEAHRPLIDTLYKTLVCHLDIATISNDVFRLVLEDNQRPLAQRSAARQQFQAALAMLMHTPADTAKPLAIGEVA